ncbi:MAG: DUF362 domain-containing protein [Brevinematia bacterium]
MKKVVIEDVEDYNSKKIKDAIKKGVLQNGFSFPANEKVLLKPNIFSQNFPEQHSITHFTIVEALCNILKENNCEIFIGESIAFYQKGLTKKAFKTSRIEEVAIKYDARLVPFEEERLIGITQDFTILKKLYLPEILFKVDSIINLPKLKTHSAMRLSGAVKNLYGCIPGGFKQKAHLIAKDDFEFSDILIDLNLLIKPHLNIIDAIYALDGGPTALGRPKKLGKILISDNPFAVDVVVARMIGYEPEDISTLIRAKERGLVDFDDIEIKGNFLVKRFNSLIKGDFAKEIKPSIFVTKTYVSPYVDNTVCNKCYKCLEFCTPKAIEKSETSYPVVNYERCVYCYYCFSGCPKKAIKPESAFLNKFINFVRAVLRI